MPDVTWIPVDEKPETYGHTTCFWVRVPGWGPGVDIGRWHPLVHRGGYWTNVAGGDFTNMVTHYAEIEYPPPPEEGWVAAEREQVTPRVQSKPFRCECGCNVFTFVAKHANGSGRYKCNACGALFEGEPLPPPEDAR